MKRILILAGLYCFAGIVALRAQSGAGALEFTAKVTPTAAKAEPAREFTIYLLTKSYGQIAKELDERDGPPSREKFIDARKLSPELREWLHNHDGMDITRPGCAERLTPWDALHVRDLQ